MNRNDDRNWNEFRRYPNYNYDDRDHYNMNTNRRNFYGYGNRPNNHGSYFTDKSRMEDTSHINQYKNPADEKVVDPYEKSSLSIQSSESSKKRKIDEEDVNLSGITDPSKATGLGHLIPLLTDFSKNSQGNSLKISADDFIIEISASNNNNNHSLHQKGGGNVSDAQKIRKHRQRKLTHSKRRKEAALKKQVLELQKQLAQSTKNDSRSSDDSHSE